MENLKETKKNDLSHYNKNLIDIGLIIFIIGTFTILLTLKYTKFKDDKKYKEYFIQVYQDFVKFLFIEGIFIIIETMNTGKFQLSTSLKRLAVVQTALIMYNFIKPRIGLEENKLKEEDIHKIIKTIK
jgi:hypothetical protein